MSCFVISNVGRLFGSVSRCVSVGLVEIVGVFGVLINASTNSTLKKKEKKKLI